MVRRLTLNRRIHMNKSLMATAVALAFGSSAALANPTNNAGTVTINPPAATTQTQATAQPTDVNAQGANGPAFQQTATAESTQTGKANVQANEGSTATDNSNNSKTLNSTKTNTKNTTVTKTDTKNLNVTKTDTKTVSLS